jgi:hypothetical protein
MKTKNNLIQILPLAVLAFNLCLNQPVRADSFVPTGSLNLARDFHTATLLTNGQVLVAGGQGASGGDLLSAELYDPIAGAWANTGSLNVPRFSHTATLLTNGNVLVAGGNGTNGILSSTELYNPVNGTWITQGSMTNARIYHTATLLANGLVLVAGGGGANVSAELFNPASGTWTPTGSLNTNRYNHTATLLTNGMVLVVGGQDGVTEYLGSAELYDPATGAWTLTGSLNIARRDHTATLLSNGQVLVANGSAYGGPTRYAELYDPTSGKWTLTSPAAAPRSFHTATLLQNSQVLVAGGADASSVLASADLYNPATLAWTTASNLITARDYHTTTLLANGHTLVAGGIGIGNVILASSELYLPDVGSLAVTLGPPGAVSAGAQWQVDGGAFQNSGTVVGNLTMGNHTVAFNTVAGWFTPASQMVTITSGATNTATATYQPDFGSLKVTMGPPGAVSAGAQWQVDGGAFQNSGTVVTNLIVGNHTVAFNTVAGWFTPASQMVMVTLNVTNTATATYTPNIGALQVNLEPICAVEKGAQWQVDGGSWQNSGAVVTNLAGGNHTVSLSAVTGWLSPGNQTLSVTANTTNTYAVNYIETTTPGDITWIAIGGGNNNWSTATNWDLNRAPSPDDVVLIPNTGGSICVMDVDATIAGLVIGECDGVGSDGLNMNNHTLAVNGPITVKSNAVFAINSGVLIGTNNTVISGVLGWTAGTLGGTLTLASNCVLNTAGTTYNKNFAGTILTNYGIVNWTSDQLNGSSGATIYNYGLWNAQDDHVFGGSGTTFNNFGTFRKSGGANTYPGTLFYGVAFNQLAGVTDIQNGTNGLQLTLQGGGNLTGGYFTTNSAGYTSLSIGNFTINGTTTTTNVVTGATLVGTNAIRGGLTWQNGSWNNTVVTVGSNSVLSINATTYNKNFTGCLFTNYGTVNWSADELYAGGGTVINNYGLWNAQDNQTFGGAGAVFNNYGTFRKSGGAGGYPGTLFAGGTFFNQAGGIIDVQTADLTFQGTYSLTNGTLSFGINSLTDNGVLLVGGATIGGSLRANVNGNFAPAIGDQWGVLGASSLTGTFSSVSLPTGFALSYTNNSVVLTVVSAVPVQILAPQLAGTNLSFQFPTASGQSYTVQQNTNLATTNWTFYTNLTGSGSVMQIFAPATNKVQNFFRVTEP